MVMPRGLLKFDLLGLLRSEVNSQLIDLSGYAKYIKWLSTVIYENFNKPLGDRGDSEPKCAFIPA